MKQSFEDVEIALARLKHALQNMRLRLDEARYALVAGNTAGEPVPPEVIGRWLDYIGGTRERREVNPNER